MTFRLTKQLFFFDIPNARCAIQTSSQQPSSSGREARRENWTLDSMTMSVAHLIMG